MQGVEISLGGYVYICGNESVLRQRIRKVWQGPAGESGGNVPQVYLFRRWLERILAEAGFARPVIGAAVRQVLLREVCRSFEGKFEYLKGMNRFPGFIRSVGKFIGELKEAGVTPERFASIVGDGSWSSKDREVARIYLEYQRALAAVGVLDAQGMVREVTDLLRKSSGRLLSGIQTIVCEGFTGFSLAEKELFDTVRAAGIEVIAGFEAGRAATAGPAGGRSVKAPIETGAVKLVKAAGPEDEAKWIAKEIKRLLRSGQIAHPGRIAIAFRSPTQYLRRVQETLAAEGVPVGARLRVRLADIPIIRLVARLLDAAAKVADSGRAGDLIDVLASDYLAGFSGMEPDAFQEAVAPFRSNQSVEKWAAELEPVGETDERVARAREGVLRLYNLLVPLAASGTAEEHRRRLLEVLAGLELEEALFAGQAAAGNGADAGDMAALALELRGLQRFVSLLEEVERGYLLAGAAGQRIFFSEYVTVVRDLMEGLTLGERGPADPRGGVELLAPDELCDCEFEAVFIAGMAEGIFPQGDEFDWLYRDNERKRLNDRGLQVPCRETADSGEEQLFRAAVGAASRFLYLTFPAAGESGRTNLPSRFLEDLAGANGLLAPETTRSGSEAGPAWEEVATVEELASKTFHDYRFLSPEIRGRLLAHLEASRYPVQDMERRMRIEESRDGGEFGPWDGVLLNIKGDAPFGINAGGPSGINGVDAPLRARFGPEAILSVSDLQDYGKCPMRFFFQKILGLKPTEEAAMEAAPATEGSIIHQALHDFYRRRLGVPLDPAKAGGYHEELDRVVDQLFGEGTDKQGNRDGLAASSGVHPVLWRLQQERIRVLLHRLLDADLEVAGKTGGRMAPRFLELRFGPGRPGEIADPQSMDSPLILCRVPADQVRIAGKIDRVDCPVHGGDIGRGDVESGDAGRGDAGQFIVYDYKLSKGANSKEMQAGADLQIPLYIRAIQELFLKGYEAAGGAYYSVREAKRAGVWRGDRPELTGVGGRTGGQMDSEAWESMVRRVENETWRRVDGMRQGWFPCMPQDANICRSCAYGAICRYEPHRIRRKIMAQGTIREGGAQDAGNV